MYSVTEQICSVLSLECGLLGFDSHLGGLGTRKLLIRTEGGIPNISGQQRLSSTLSRLRLGGHFRLRE